MSSGQEIQRQIIRFVHGAAPSLPPAVSRALGLPAMESGDGGAGGEGPHGSGEELAEELAEVLTGEAVGLLDEVLTHPAASRDVAFRLLAADALLTWSCEAAADGRDPGEILGSLAKRLAARET